MGLWKEKIKYIHLSHALKNTANQGPGSPLDILWNAKRVVFHSYAQQFTGIPLRTAQKPALNLFNSCEPLRTFLIICGKFTMISDRALPKISEEFPNISKFIKTSEKHFWTVSKVFWKFQKISKHFWRSPNILKPFWTNYEFFQNFSRLSNIFPKHFLNRLIKFPQNGFEAFPKFSEIPEDFWALRKISVSFPTI